jgi:hypothetical protein
MIAIPTTLDDVDSYLPLTRLHEFVAEGCIGSLASNFHVVYSQYSQRKPARLAPHRFCNGAARIMSTWYCWQRCDPSVTRP